ncbi:hypothetical protein KIN20_000665 [Parelaphostrongylus tenuis]|uniref:NET domain-containing protein n=1 Tax=Parelaphostrongylus tenuis TaxID=148309 RepID=A0AAD5QBZ6_PARTN|nr:hypothetical protein KIN20_000665 [Parelaphostrongylus tenuis]
MSYMEQLLLAEHLQLLNDDHMGTVVDIILKHNGLTIPDDENHSISIAFRDLKPITLREIATYVDSVLSSSPTSGNDDSKTKNGKTKSDGARRKTQPTRKRTDIDIEARKRELMGGIRRLGGTGATKPIKKHAPYTDKYAQLKRFYAQNESTAASSSTTSASCQFSSSSDTVVSEDSVKI